jgi:hypothetical protein
MTTENKCPHCGAELLDKRIEAKYFSCGSTEWYWPGHARYLFERNDDCYERQIAALQAELAKRQWQPIETAPKDGTDILVWDGRERFVVFYYRGASHWLMNCGSTCIEINPTHWQPIPEPPKE